VGLFPVIAMQLMLRRGVIAISGYGQIMVRDARDHNQ
jgi:hypothetical protein